MSTVSATQKTDERAESPTTAKAAEQAHELLDRVADYVANAETRLRSVAEEAEKNLADKKSKVTATANERVEKVEQWTREKPLTAIGVALAAGFVTARILGR